MTACDSHRLLSCCHPGNRAGGGRSLATAISFVCVSSANCSTQRQTVRRLRGTEGRLKLVTRFGRREKVNLPWPVVRKGRRRRRQHLLAWLPGGRVTESGGSSSPGLPLPGVWESDAFHWHSRGENKSISAVKASAGNPSAPGASPDGPRSVVWTEGGKALPWRRGSAKTLAGFILPVPLSPSKPWVQASRAR